MQLARKDHANIDAASQQTVEKFLTEQKVSYTKTYIDAGGSWSAFRMSSSS